MAGFMTALKPPTTPFEKRVHAVVQNVPRGRVATYADVAFAAGRPGAARAVGNIMASNNDTARTPCHRVVRSDGNVGGYMGGVQGAGRKARRLAEEGVPVGKDGWIRSFDDVRWRPGRN